jgi:lysophospholipase L1-like esterase
MNRDPMAMLQSAHAKEGATHIKLLGDSITHGVGGTGFAQTGAPIAGKYFRNPDGYCWAKRFKEMMESRFDCIVTNNGCTGTRIEFILNHFDELVESHDDFILCTIGTNNRHQFKKDGPKRDRDEMIETFYRNVLALNQKFVEIKKPVVFVANLPSSANDEADKADYWRILHMDDINAIYKRAQKQAGFELVSVYDGVGEYISEHNMTIDPLLSDGLHPNDEGYRVIFDILKEKLEI